jgi:hexosaminidase
MNVLLTATLLGCCYAAAVKAMPEPRVPTSPAPRALPVWPLPRAVTTGTASASLLPAEQFALGIAVDTLPSTALEVALERFRMRAFPHPVTLPDAPLGSRSVVTGLTVHVADSTVALTLGVNESYTLVVPVSGNATISAATVFGAYRGLESLSQLIQFSFVTESYQIDDLLPLQIEDAPQFVHRGLLLDVARHFQPVASLLRVIDSLAMAKINVLHLHMSEDQSFPAASRVHPELAAKGAWSSHERYTWQELREVVEFGQGRGLRVIPEIDMPGHATSWHASHPELFSSGAPAAKCSTQVDGRQNVTRAALDPAKNATFAFIEELLRDYFSESGGVFSNIDYVHLGADEVPIGCWDNPFDTAFIEKHGLQGGTAGLFSYFVERVHEIANKLGRRVIMWDAAFNKGSTPPPKDIVIQMWLQYGGTNTLLQNIVKAGYRAIASPDVPWYLNVVEPQDAACNTHWKCLRNYNPRAGLNSAEQALVLGGEGCLWTETVDSSDIESTLWPRMAAIAERLWSGDQAAPQAGASASATAAFEQGQEDRLRKFRCLLLERGFGAGVVGDTVGEPSRPVWQRLHGPPGPGSCTQDTNLTVGSN